jgi:hypothetical protein
VKLAQKAICRGVHKGEDSVTLHEAVKFHTSGSVVKTLTPGLKAAHPRREHEKKTQKIMLWSYL